MVPKFPCGYKPSASYALASTAFEVAQLWPT